MLLFIKILFTTANLSSIVATTQYSFKGDIETVLTESIYNIYTQIHKYRYILLYMHIYINILFNHSSNSLILILTKTDKGNLYVCTISKFPKKSEKNAFPFSAYHGVTYGCRQKCLDKSLNIIYIYLYIYIYMYLFIHIGS